MIIVNGFQPLTIITKYSILDVAAALDPPLHVQIVTSEYNGTSDIKIVLCSTCVVLDFLSYSFPVY